jgi:hypothetical protein
MILRDDDEPDSTSKMSVSQMRASMDTKDLESDPVSEMSFHDLDRSQTEDAHSQGERKPVTIFELEEAASKTPLATVRTTQPARPGDPVDAPDSPAEVPEC